LITELAVRYILGFPTYGVEKKLLGIKKSTATSNIFYPHSKYYNVEDGFKVYKRNNLGLYGKDVSWDKNDTLVYVLGSSFLEAAQWPPDSMATSHFQKKLDIAEKQYKVINIARSGHDPYDLYFRLTWFERQFGHGNVILILDDVYREWLARHKHPLSFQLAPTFGHKIDNLSSIMGMFILNNSAFTYLLKQAVQLDDAERNDFLSNRAGTKSTIVIPNDLLFCLSAYQKKYGDAFLLLSIIDNIQLDRELMLYCKENCINYSHFRINIAENKINSRGHLNLRGNRILGTALYDTFKKIY